MRRVRLLRRGTEGRPDHFQRQDWRRAPHTAQQMFEVFPIMRQLHELLWYLAEALTLPPARPLHGELGRALEETERLTYSSPDALLELDVAAHRQAVNALLLRASELVRAGVRRPRKNRAGADLSGADLTGSIFLTQSQLNAAKGDAATKLPPSLTRPTHWA